MLFNTTQPEYTPPVGSEVNYWVNGSKFTIPMPEIEICNLQDELDKVRFEIWLESLALHWSISDLYWNSHSVRLIFDVSWKVDSIRAWLGVHNIHWCHQSVQLFSVLVDPILLNALYIGNWLTVWDIRRSRHFHYRYETVSQPEERNLNGYVVQILILSIILFLKISH
jgi:hypothetical protein